MVKLARDLVRKGELGPVRKIVAEYPQGWLATPLERTGMKQADWRTDPARSGAAGCMGDIGTHAENLAEYVTGQRIAELAADLTTFVDGRRLDDDGNVLVRFEGGARGVLFASQVSVGEENGLAIRVYGERRGLRWRQEAPNTLQLTSLDGPEETWSRGNGYVAEMSPAAGRATRLPAGHPGGLLRGVRQHLRERLRHHPRPHPGRGSRSARTRLSDRPRRPARHAVHRDGGLQREVGGEVDPDAGGIGQ